MHPIHDLATITDLSPATGIKLLTAQPNYHGHDTTVLENFKKGRTNWVEWNLRHIIPDPETHLIMCDRADKKNHAPGCVLIDDYGKNCEEWKQAGGVAIQVTKGPQDISRIALHALNLINKAKELLSKPIPVTETTTEPQGASS